MVHTICYSLNRARQPLEATLGLEPENEKNPSEEFQDWLFEDPKYMSRELKALGPAQEDDFDLSIIENAVRNQLIRIEGKEPGEFPKPKSFLASYIFNAVGAGGSYMSAFPEIAFVNNFHDASNLWHPLRQHAVAHELFHSKGYISEKEAEMLAHLAGMQSRIPALRRSELLYRLRRNLSIETKDGRPIKERIYEADLPDYVIEVFVKMQASQNKQEAKPKAIKLLMNIPAFGRDQLAFLLAGSRTSDYSMGFLQMAYAYEQKYGRI